MHVQDKARRLVRAALQAYGPARVKRRLWDSEFSNGRWNCLDRTDGDCVYPSIERYARRGSILDLGCGSGSTGNELDPATYRRYVGVDISDVALDKAKRRSAENCRAATNHYCQSDISGYEASERFDVILFRDSIYYVPRRHIKAMLDRYTTYLKDGGVFIVRMADTDKYRAIVDTIETHFAVVDKYLANDPKAIVLVFR